VGNEKFGSKRKNPVQSKNKTTIPPSQKSPGSSLIKEERRVAEPRCISQPIDGLNKGKTANRIMQRALCPLGQCVLDMLMKERQRKVEKVEAETEGEDYTCG